MDMVRSLTGTDVQVVLLVLTNAVLGTTRTVEGLAALGVVPRLTKTQARWLKAGTLIACGILQLANAIFLAGGH